MSAKPHDSPTPLAEISQGPSVFEQFLDRNQKNLIALAVLLALGTAAYVVYDGLRQGAQTTAGNELMKAADTAAFRQVAETHKDSLAGGTAKVLLAERLWTEDKKDDAVQTLRSFLSGQPTHPAAPAARANLAAKLMSQGKTADATKEFESLVSDSSSSYLAPYALLCLGDLALTAGNPEKAAKYYDQVKTQYADSDFAKTVTERSAALKAKLPAEVEPPPAPPAEKAAPASAPAASPAAPAASAPATPAQP